MDERGRLPGATALATGRPSSTARDEKSVSWLLRKNPPTARPEPNSDSTDVVIDATSPAASTTTKWLVPATSTVASAPKRDTAASCSGSPATGGAPARSRSVARGSRCSGDRAALRRAPRRTPDRRYSGRDPRTSGGSLRRTGTTPAGQPARASRCRSARGSRAAAAAPRRSTAAVARTPRTRGRDGTAGRTSVGGRPRSLRARACPARLCVGPRNDLVRDRWLEQGAWPRSASWRRVAA